MGKDAHEKEAMNHSRYFNDDTDAATDGIYAGGGSVT